jgi:hypothetical protein
MGLVRRTARLTAGLKCAPENGMNTMSRSMSPVLTRGSPAVESLLRRFTAPKKVRPRVYPTKRSN